MTTWFSRCGYRLLLLVGLLVISLFAVPLGMPTLFAQTGAPPPAEDPVLAPPPGTTVVQPLFPALPPPGVPAVTQDGLLAVLPPAENAVAVLTLVIGGIRTTLIVPTDPEIAVAVRIQPNEGPLPAPLPDSITATLSTFTLDLYNAADGTPINSHTPPLTFSAALAPAIVTSAVLWHFDEAAGVYETILLNADPVTGIVSGELSETSPFVLTTTKAGVVVPDGLPNTGGSAEPPLAWGFVVLVGSAGIVWWCRHRLARLENR